MLRLISRYDTIRTIQKISDKIAEFKAFETLYCTQSGNDFNDPDSVDPDGGPYIYKGMVIKFDNNEVYTIEKFTDIVFDKDKEEITALIHIKKQ